MIDYTFILASSSPRRQEILSTLGINFKIILPDIDEIELPYENPADCVRRLSREKAQNVAYQLNYSPSIILAADTVIVVNSKEEPDKEIILGKPLDQYHARKMLNVLRSSSHKVLTGITLTRTGITPIQFTKAVLTTVFMRDYSDKEIDEYLATNTALDKAGGYGIQDTKFNPVDHIEGSYSNVVGLPQETVVALLREINFPITFTVADTYPTDLNGQKIST